MRNREKGVSSLSLVLALLLLGTLMLNGLHQQLSGRFAALASESSALKAFSAALSALAWAERQPWRPDVQWQCQRSAVNKWRACVKVVKPERIVVAAREEGEAAAPLTLWRWAIPGGNGIRYAAHGWSDFCPLEEASQCPLPDAP